MVDLIILYLLICGILSVYYTYINPNRIPYFDLLLFYIVFWKFNIKLNKKRVATTTILFIGFKLPWWGFTKTLCFGKKIYRKVFTKKGGIHA